MNKAQFVILADELSKDPAGIGYDSDVQAVLA